MPPSSSLNDRLSAFGVQLPEWPEEPNADCSTAEWIIQGQLYAESIRLLRIQLVNAIKSDKDTCNQVVLIFQEAGRLSRWNQAVINYLLPELEGLPNYHRVQAKAKLVVADWLSGPQLLGILIDLARCGYVVTCAFAAIRLLEEYQVTYLHCLDLCCLLAYNVQLPNLEHRSFGERWYLEVCVYSSLTHSLKIAEGISRSDYSQDLLKGSLRQLAQAISEFYLNKGEEDEDENLAIQLALCRVRQKKNNVINRTLVRTIHHFACSGGTVICKCLAAMPNVVVLSEVNPNSRTSGGNFQPANPLILLERSHRRFTQEEIKEQFLNDVSKVSNLCYNDDVDLIIRDHSHTDFCIGSGPSNICPVVDFLSEDYSLLSLITVRHPLDSYLSLKASKWNTQFSPSTFSEYTRRYHYFLDRYSKCPWHRYEDFCENPLLFMKNICKFFEISYHPSFIRYFGNFNLSGDSGRSGQQKIRLRNRRSIPEDVQNEINESEVYIELLERLGYN